MRTQKQRVADTFYEQPKTMLMVAEETEIRRANLCWYVSKLRQHDNIFLVKKGICEVSKYPGVGYYTTPPDLMKGGNHGR